MSVTLTAMSFLSVFHPLDASLLCLAIYTLNASEGNIQVIIPCVFNEVNLCSLVLNFFFFFQKKGFGKVLRGIDSWFFCFLGNAGMLGSF